MSNLVEQVENVSLLLSMLGDDDDSGLSLIFDVLHDIKANAGSNELQALCQEIITKQEELAFKELVALLNNSIAELQQLASSGGEAEVKAEEESSSPEVREDACQELIIEFIEKYGEELNVFSARVLSTDGNEDDKSFILGFLHTLKGDAGAVGLLGIHDATHFIEDRFLNAPSEQAHDELLSFANWTLDCVEALKSAYPADVSSKEFIKQISATVIPERREDSEQKVEENESDDDWDLPYQVPQLVERAPYAIEGDIEVLGEFIAEGEDQLATIEAILLEDKVQYTEDDLSAIFRCVHSLKGGSAYFNLVETKDVSHVAESLMDKVRNGTVYFCGTLSKLILEFIDLQRDRFEAYRDAAQNGTEVQPSRATAEFEVRIEDFLISANLVEDTTAALGNKVNSQSKTKQSDESESKVESERNSDVPVPTPTSTPVPSAKTQEPQSQSQASTTTKSKSTEKLAVKDYVKVETQRLDYLVESIGEMIIYTSMLIGLCRNRLPNDQDVTRISHQIEKFSRDLQDVGMSMRLVPVKGLFQRMSRLVWDTCKKLNKEISFETEGEDTELDRNLIDKLSDPLMHMIRNSLDHGIESPDVREAQGKPRKGTVRLTASHSGGNVFIRISDDGKGLDPEMIRTKAISKGLITESTELSEDEVLQLIFAPGFSTAEQVTDLSGRGVGMDVVRKNIELLNGSVRIASTVGEGTEFSIEIPLTLAMIDGIELSVGCERFILPTLSIVELLRPNPELITLAYGQAETYEFRGHQLPIYRLSRLLDITSDYENPLDGVFVVVTTGTELFVLVVDKIIGQYQTVIKNLGSSFSGEQGIAGCAIMADGHPSLILDVRSLKKLALTSYKPMGEMETLKALSAESISLN